jgi:hypothetical protein
MTFVDDEKTDDTTNGDDEAKGSDETNGDE